MLPVSNDVKALATHANSKVDFGEFGGKDYVPEQVEQVVFEQGLAALLLVMPDTVKGFPVEALVLSWLRGLIDTPEDTVPKLAVAMGMTPDPLPEEC